MDRAASDSRCFFDFFDFFWFHQDRLTHTLGSLKAQSVACRFFMGGFDLLIRVEKKKRIQATNLEHEASHVSLLIKLFSHVKVYETFESFSLFIFSQVSSSFNRGRFGHIQSRQLQLR